MLISKSRKREEANKSTREVGGNNKEEEMAGDNKEEMAGGNKEEMVGDSKEQEDKVGKVIMVGVKEWFLWGVKIFGEIIYFDTIGSRNKEKEMNLTSLVQDSKPLI